jgi:hypothetical protein
MGLFRRRGASGETSQPQFPSLGSGRRLHSALAVTDCLAHLEAILLSYRPLESAYRTPYVVPGWQWNGSQQQEQPPETIITFGDADKEPLFAAFWPDRGGTECGLFPLGSGDERLSSLPIIGHWKQRDPSLTSIGVVPRGLITLAPPRVPSQFVEEMLKTAGFPSTPRNIEAIGTMVGRMFLAKANQFIASQDPRSTDHFVQSHIYTGDSVEKYCQRVLDDLATWNPGLLPYIQDTPMRVRAISLEAGNVPGTMWSALER